MRARYGCLEARNSWLCTAGGGADKGQHAVEAALSPFLPRRAICDSAPTGVHAQAVSRPPSSATTAGVWSARLALALALAPKQQLYFPPPPPVSLFPQSLSLFPSLRQLSRTCTTQRVPCVALPIAAFPASYPRPSSNKLPRAAVRPFPAPAPPAPLVCWYVLHALVVVRGLRAFVAPQPSPPARRAFGRLVPVVACAPEQVQSAVLSPPPAPCNRALALSLHSLLAATKGFSTRLLTCLVLSPSAPAFPHSSTRA